MRLTFTDEQDELRRQVRRALAEAGGVTAARRTMTRTLAAPEAGAGGDADGLDHALWRRLARELGLAGLAVPEADGGAGLGWVEIAAVAEELGAALACVPFLSSACLATATLLACASPVQRAALLPPIARGDITAALAWLESGDAIGAFDAGAIHATARRTSGDHVIVSGKKRFVIDGASADLLLVVARDERDQLGVYAIPAGASGVRRRRVPTLDATRALAEVALADVRVPMSSRLGSDADARPLLATAIARGRIALAAEQVGGAQACLDLAVAYAKVRHQFGRPIGSFQAIQHTLAELFVQVETARSAAYHAAIVASQDDPDEPLELVAAATAAYCGDAFYRCAADTIQVHGGIGFTWEHDAHLYFKRARASRMLLGTPDGDRDAVARALGLGADRADRADQPEAR